MRWLSNASFRDSGYDIIGIKRCLLMGTWEALSLHDCVGLPYGLQAENIKNLIWENFNIYYDCSYHEKESYWGRLNKITQPFHDLVMEIRFGFKVTILLVLYINFIWIRIKCTHINSQLTCMSAGTLAIYLQSTSPMVDISHSWHPKLARVVMCNDLNGKM